jgi:hypothetical protein
MDQLLGLRRRQATKAVHVPFFFCSPRQFFSSKVAMDAQKPFTFLDPSLTTMSNERVLHFVAALSDANQIILSLS